MTEEMEIDSKEVVEVKVKKEKKDKKEKKEKKDKVKKEKKEKKIKKDEAETNGPSNDDLKSESPSPNSPNTSKKRKRDAEEPILEVDLSLPTPPSKKQLRKLKKAAPEGVDPKSLLPPSKAAPATSADGSTTDGKPTPKPGPHASQSRTQHGVWIGNLAFRTTEGSLRGFLLGEGSPLEEEDIVRVNLPMKTHGTRGNKGFAYVDFKSEKGVVHALSLSETELEGRRVLIKSSSDYSGRPKKEEKKKEAVDEKDGENGETARTPVKKETHGNPPGKTVWVGNLPFEVTDDEIREHFKFAGEIAKVRTARFQDTGKCKGFTFVDFTTVDAARRAIAGVSLEDKEKLEGKEEIKFEKIRKNRMKIGGNKIKMEFGEDAQTRYKKRFGGKKKEQQRDSMWESNGSHFKENPERRPGGFGSRPEKKVDARSVKPGAALAAAPRLTGGIVESTGKKVTFDD